MSRELKEMRECHPGEEHQGRRDNIAKAQRSEQVWPTAGTASSRVPGQRGWGSGREVPEASGARPDHKRPCGTLFSLCLKGELLV